MKPVPALIAPESTFFIREVKQAFFSSEFHFHPECQLAYTIRGSGKRIVGDSVENFSEGELVFMGANLPHVWFNMDRKLSKSKKVRSISLSLFISPEKLIDHLQQMGDVQKIVHLFHKSKRGMIITGDSKIKLISLLKKAYKEKNDSGHIITLMKVVHLLTETKEYRFLASQNYSNHFHLHENERMHSVYEYLMKNFRKEISLKEVSGIASMNPNAFCRFFKSRKQTSLMQVVNEIRIGHACGLLANPDETISQVAYKSGFNNVSNFNHFFKLIKKTSPRVYRKQLELK
jgi:AraC-like DNA-binding protein